MKKVLELSEKDKWKLSQGYVLESAQVPKAGNWVEAAYARAGRSVLEQLLEEEALQHSADAEYAEECAKERQLREDCQENETYDHEENYDEDC